MGDAPECPKCGGELYVGGGTTAYTYASCLDCDYLHKEKTGRYR